MTLEEKMQQRREYVRILFQKTGEDFAKEVLARHRGGDPAPTAAFRAEYDVSDHELFGRRWYRIRSKGAVPKGKTKKILYLHGGAFVLETGPAEHVYSGWLSDQTGVEVWFVDYPLAPEASAQDAIKMVTALYEMMLKENSADEIALMGSSAGGGIAICAAKHFREIGLPQPNSMTLYSPCYGFALPTLPDEIAYLAVLEERDPMISYRSMPTIGTLWRGSLPEDSALWDPSVGSLTGLAPIQLFAGTGEVLNLAARRLARDAEQQHAKIRYIEREMKPHCWILSPGDETAEDRKYVTEVLLDPSVI